MMDLREFADMLDGGEYGHEITKEEEALAKEHGFVVVFGYSDDNAELRGAIDDEIGCFDGGKLRHKKLPGVIYAKWCAKGSIFPWTYETSIPHEEFEIFEDGEPWCVGIVCDIKKRKTRAERMVEMIRNKECDALLDWWQDIFEDGVPSASYFREWLQGTIEDGDTE